jgi:hypothetical protein
MALTFDKAFGVCGTGILVFSRKAALVNSQGRNPWTID